MLFSVTISKQRRRQSRWSSYSEPEDKSCSDANVHSSNQDSKTQGLQSRQRGVMKGWATIQKGSTTGWGSATEKPQMGRKANQPAVADRLDGLEDDSGGLWVGRMEAPRGGKRSRGRGAGRRAAHHVLEDEDSAEMQGYGQPHEHR